VARINTARDWLDLALLHVAVPRVAVPSVVEARRSEHSWISVWSIDVPCRTSTGGARMSRDEINAVLAAEGHRPVRQVQSSIGAPRAGTATNTADANALVVDCAFIEVEAWTTERDAKWRWRRRRRQWW